MTKFGDWPEDALADCDILVGGTPCQSFSIAGLRKSLDDDRGNLMLVYVKLWNRINDVRRSRGRPPAIALWENVPGCLSTKDNAFGCLLGGLMGCDEPPVTQDGKWHKAGFLSSESVRVGWRVIDAQYFGVAQRRRRVFVVAVPSEIVERFGDRRCPSAILSLRESLCGNPPTRGASGKDVAGAIVARAARNGGSSNQDVDSGQLVFGGNNTSGAIDVTPACLSHPTRQDFASEAFVVSDDPTHAICANEQRTYTNEGSVFQLRKVVGHPFVKAKRAQSTSDDETWVPGDVAPTQSPFDQGDVRATTVVAQPVAFDTTQMTSKLNHSHPKAGDPMHPLAAGADAPAVVAFKESQSGCRTGDVHATIDSNKGSRRQEGVLTDLAVRRLTPRECERLQGFPDNYTAVTYRKKPAADGPRYKALGNSMAVPCMWWLGYRIGLATDTLPHKRPEQ